MRPARLAISGALLFVAGMLVLALPLSAARRLGPRDPYAVIAGTVYAANDLPVYGVKVKIRAAVGKKVLDEAFSDHMGEFAFRVPAGSVDYVVWADLKDKRAAEQTAVKVSIANDERQDISLHLPADNTSKAKK